MLAAVVTIEKLVMPDGRLLSWSEDKTLRLWDLKIGMQIGPVMRHDGAVFGALVMPDGRMLSWSDDKTMRLWDTITGTQIGPAMRHNRYPNAALVMPDGKLLSWSDDSTLRQWDAKTGMQIGPVMCHDGRVRSALVMPNRLLSWSNDYLQLWDANTGAQIGPAMRHDSVVSGALVMPDGRLLSWSEDNTLRQWDANWPAGPIFAIACALLPDVDMKDVLDRYHLAKSAPICVSPKNIPLPDWSRIERASD